MTSIQVPARPQMIKEDVEELRRMFFEKYNPDDGGGIFDDRDLDRVRADDHFLHGFLLTTASQKAAALVKLASALKWRKEYGVNDITLESFPDWALNLGGVFPHGRDLLGRRILWFKVATHKKDASKAVVAKRFITYWLDKLHKENPGETVVILEDMTNAGLANMDMDVIGFKIKCFEERFPGLVGIMLVYNMPWYLNAIWKLIEKLLSAESKAHIRFLFGNDIQQYISKDQLPSHMGGTDTYQWTWPPPDNEESVEEISLLQNSMEETFEQASEELATTPQPGTIARQSQLAETETLPNGDAKPRNSTVKKVTFSPDTEDNENRGYSMLSTSSSLTRLKQKKSAKKSRAKDVAKGSLLTIRPGEQLTFNPPPTTSSATQSTPQSSLVLSLTNTTDKRVAYKVKTTTPDRYRVRPSAGPINPGASINITITLLSGNQEEVSKDKFLVLSTELKEVIRTPVELSNYWRTVSRENIVEHRMKCQYNLPSAQEMEFKWIREHMLALSKNLETIEKHTTVLERRTSLMQLILRLQFVVIFFVGVICSMWAMGWIDLDDPDGVCHADQRGQSKELPVYTKVFETPA